MITTRESNPAASWRTDAPADEWDYRELRDQLDARAAALGVGAPIPQYPRSSSGQVVDVYVNHSRWLWDCPICAASYMAAATARGFCTNCFNAGAGWYQLRWPADRPEIERALDARPDPATRNWFPTETLAELLAQNEAHEVAA